MIGIMSFSMDVLEQWAGSIISTVPTRDTIVPIIQRLLKKSQDANGANPGDGEMSTYKGSISIGNGSVKVVCNIVKG
jgi:hypothetical protein